MLLRDSCKKTGGARRGDLITDLVGGATHPGPTEGGEVRWGGLFLRHRKGEGGGPGGTVVSDFFLASVRARALKAPKKKKGQSLTLLGRPRQVKKNTLPLCVYGWGGLTVTTPALFGGAMAFSGKFAKNPTCKGFGRGGTTRPPPCFVKHGKGFPNPLANGLPTKTAPDKGGGTKKLGRFWRGGDSITGTRF